MRFIKADESHAMHVKCLEMSKYLLVVALFQDEDLVCIVETKALHVNGCYHRARVSGIERFIHRFVALMCRYSRIAVDNLCCELRRCGLVNWSAVCL